jgi:hypothetical protein
MFAGKAIAYPNESPFRFSFKALPTNVRLGSKGLSVTNTLAYYKYSKLPTKKSIYNIGPWLPDMSRRFRPNRLESNSDGMWI